MGVRDRDTARAGVMCISAPMTSLICLHDLTLDRTSTTSGRAYEHTVATQAAGFRLSEHARSRTSSESWSPRELMIMVRDARRDHVPVSLVIETKHQRSGSRGRSVRSGDACRVRLGSPRLTGTAVSFK